MQKTANIGVIKRRHIPNRGAGGYLDNYILCI